MNNLINTHNNSTPSLNFSPLPSEENNNESEKLEKHDDHDICGTHFLSVYKYKGIKCEKNKKAKKNNHMKIIREEKHIENVKAIKTEEVKGQTCEDKDKKKKKTGKKIQKLINSVNENINMNANNDANIKKETALEINTDYLSHMDANSNSADLSACNNVELLSADKNPNKSTDHILDGYVAHQNLNNDDFSILRNASEESLNGNACNDVDKNDYEVLTSKQLGKNKNIYNMLSMNDTTNVNNKLDKNEEKNINAISVKHKDNKILKKTKKGGLLKKGTSKKKKKGDITNDQNSMEETSKNKMEGYRKENKNTNKEDTHMRKTEGYSCQNENNNYQTKDNKSENTNSNFYEIEVNVTEMAKGDSLNKEDKHKGKKKKKTKNQNIKFNPSENGNVTLESNSKITEQEKETTFDTPKEGAIDNREDSTMEITLKTKEVFENIRNSDDRTDSGEKNNVMDKIIENSDHLNEHEERCDLDRNTEGKTEHVPACNALNEKEASEIPPTASIIHLNESIIKKDSNESLHIQRIPNTGLDPEPVPYLEPHPALDEPDINIPDINDPFVNELEIYDSDLNPNENPLDRRTNKNLQNNNALETMYYDDSSSLTNAEKKKKERQKSIIITTLLGIGASILLLSTLGIKLNKVIKRDKGDLNYHIAKQELLSKMFFKH